MSRKKPRHLSAEEKQLWSRVTETAKPLNARSLSPDLPSKPLISKPSRAKVNLDRLAKPAPTNPKTLTSIDLAPSISERLNRHPVEMDSKAFRKMKSGKLKPEARIDLHGMTLAEAQPRLTRFILDAYDDQKRLVLVITGKGKSRDHGGPIPVRFGVLRNQVPAWLKQFPLGPLVLQTTTANQRHGGEGALYVYLKRRR